jgi:hypothetical protein
VTDPDAPPANLPQLVIDPSVVRTLAINLSLAFGIVVSSMTTIVGLASRRDLAGWIVWIQSEDFVKFLGALGFLLTMIAFVWRSLARKWREVYLARHVKDEIAVVKAPSLPPAVDAVIPPPVA